MSTSRLVFQGDHALINRARFRRARGCNVNPNTPYRDDGKMFKSSEELWIAKLLRTHGVLYHYEEVEFPHFCPDFVFDQPFVWTGKPCKNQLIWGIEVKKTRHHPRWPEWKAKSEALYAMHQIKILLLAREQIQGYYHRGFIPLARPA